MNEVDRLCRRLDHSFSDRGLLQEALSHRSSGSRNYERLEFLGDGLLNFVIAAELYRLEPDLHEGDLSRLRASLVRGTTLATVARDLALGECLNLGSGELKSGGFDRASILADVLESLMGAIFLDAGFDKARSVILTLFAERLAHLPKPGDLKDPKTRLQELLQGRGLERPQYSVVNTSGRSHDPVFTVACTLPGSGKRVTAEASNRRKAEQAAASSALASIGELLP